jgi:hypothetical protein
MKSKRFTDEQIVKILQEAESGLSVADVCRKHNCSEQSFYRWKAKYGGMDVSEAKRLLRPGMPIHQSGLPPAGLALSHGAQHESTGQLLG